MTHQTDWITLLACARGFRSYRVRSHGTATAFYPVQRAANRRVQCRGRDAARWPGQVDWNRVWSDGRWRRPIYGYTIYCRSNERADRLRRVLGAQVEPDTLFKDVALLANALQETRVSSLLPMQKTRLDLSVCIPRSNAD